MEKRIVLLCVFTSFLFSATAYSAPLINGGFEAGDLTGWTTSVTYSENSWFQDTDEYPFHVYVDYLFDPFTNPYLPMPSIQTEGIQPEGNAFVSPVEGSYYLKIYGPNVGYEQLLIAPDGDAYWYAGYTTVSVSQSIFLDTGDVLSGWMALQTGDYPPYLDPAWVEITRPASGVGDLTIAVPLTLVVQDAWDNNINPYYGTKLTPWYYWEWTVPFPAVYTITLNIYGDDDLTTQGFFDGIKVAHASVPEPATMILLGTGLLGLAGYCRRKVNS